MWYLWFGHIDLLECTYDQNLGAKWYSEIEVDTEKYAEQLTRSGMTIYKDSDSEFVKI